MSYESGAVKYVVGVLLSVTGFISMYIFGGGMIATLRALIEGSRTLMYGGDVVEATVNAFIIYLLTEHLPPTSVGQVIAQAALGAVVAAILWYIAVPKKGR